MAIQDVFEAALACDVDGTPRKMMVGADPFT